MVFAPKINHFAYYKIMDPWNINDFFFATRALNLWELYSRWFAWSPFLKFNYFTFDIFSNLFPKWLIANFLFVSIWYHLSFVEKYHWEISFNRANSAFLTKSVHRMAKMRKSNIFIKIFQFLWADEKKFNYLRDES